MAKPQGIGRLAKAEAVALGHGYVGTEHLLLAISAQAGTVAASALAAQGIDRERLRAAIIQIVKTAPCESGGSRLWTPRAMKAVEFAIGEARALGHNYVGPEHLLLGLLRVVEGVSVQALQELGADLGTIHQAVIEGLEQV